MTELDSITGPILRVKDWSKMQHYRDRTPPWIKLHRSLLDDHAFFGLSDAARARLPLVWIMASDQEGVVPSPDVVAWRLRDSVDTVTDALAELLDAGFLAYGDSASTIAPWPSRYIPKATRMLVWARDSGKCCACGSSERIEIDHIQPVSKGGFSVAENLQLLCRSCNRRKHNKGNGLDSAEQDATDAVVNLEQDAPLEEKRRDRVEGEKRQSGNGLQIRRNTDAPILEGHGKPRSIPKALPAPMWNNEAAEVWFGAYGGPPPKAFFAALKPIAAREGWERVRPVLAFYLAETASEFSNVPKFGAAFLAWEERSRGKPATSKLGPRAPL